MRRIAESWNLEMSETAKIDGPAHKFDAWKDWHDEANPQLE